MTLRLDYWRIGLQPMFAFLLIFGLISSYAEGFSWRVTILSAALAAVFFARKKIPTLLWLAALCTLWLGLMVHAQHFMWLEFPLVFAFLASLPPGPGIAASVVLWALAAFVPLQMYPENWSVAEAIGPFIGTAFAVGIYFIYRRLQAEAAHHAAIATQLQRTQEALAAQEHQAGRLEERERLSREIHDTVAQGLSSIVLLSRAARGSQKGGELPPQLAEHLDLIEKTASENLAEARRFVTELSSSPKDLPGALHSLVESMNRRAAATGENTQFHLVLSGDTERSLPENVASVAYRVAQEGLNNVLKHAHAEQAVVTLGIFSDSVTVDVVDNGVGMGARHAETDGSGFGLRGLKARVEKAGGELNIESDEGTALAVCLPVEGDNHD